MTTAPPLQPVEYARQRVDELIVSEKLDVVATDVWNEIRFDDGWLLVSVREGALGARYFLAMDSGEVHHKVGSMPGRVYVESYSSAGSAANLELVNRRINREPGSTTVVHPPD